MREDNPGTLPLISISIGNHRSPSRENSFACDIINTSQGFRGENKICRNRYNYIIKQQTTQHRTINGVVYLFSTILQWVHQNFDGVTTQARRLFVGSALYTANWMPIHLFASPVIIHRRCPCGQPCIIMQTDCRSIIIVSMDGTERIPLMFHWYFH